MNVTLTALLAALTLANVVFLAVTLARRDRTSSSTTSLAFSIVLCAVAAAGLAERDVIGWMHYVTVAVFAVLTLGNGIGVLRPERPVDEPDPDDLPLDERPRTDL